MPQSRPISTPGQAPPNSPSATHSGDAVRRQFIDFFRSKPGPGTAGHTFVPSSPCVPVDDPTLLFTNAGMNQFKPIFLGQAAPGSELGKLKRAVNSQKCIRAGGKHNDLEDVGKDTYHHTFFEMLGNWSFGDYFKKEAVEWSWELLTRVYKLPAAALYATYFEGNPKAGLEADVETRDLWLRFLPKERVLPGNMKDNFWEMGESGPCGPCTEIHVDRLVAMGQTQRLVPQLVNAGDPDVIEIWNNVFIQFNREADGSLRPLPARHVDTGMGLERLTSILQGKRSNYDTDLFMPIFAEIERLTGARSYMGRLGEADVGNIDTAYRVIADHIRTLTFAITDGAVPSNEGRGYVLRRILRRAVRYGRQILNAKGGFFSQLVPVVVDRMGEAFPELRDNPRRVMAILRDEEESFGRTLDRGLRFFNGSVLNALQRACSMTANSSAAMSLAVDLEFRQMEDPDATVRGKASDFVARGEILPLPDSTRITRRFANGGTLHVSVPIGGITPAIVHEEIVIPFEQPVIASGDAFKLHDTYGFPIDLTALMAAERGLSVDMAGYERLMEEARDKARAGGKTGPQTGKLALGGDDIARLTHLNIPPTDDADKFHGREVVTSVRAIFNGENFDEAVSSDSHGLHKVGLILEKTNFYAEMGGQETDTGRVAVTRETRSNDTEGGAIGGTAGEFRVEHVQSFGGYILHIGTILNGEIRVGDDVSLRLDKARRGPIMANHTATHLLNLGLRKVLGSGVDQKGSLVAPDRLRFDFSHGQPVSPQELAKVEQIVRHQVEQDLTVYTDIAPLYVAKAVRGVRAVFGETYPDPVRVVSIGQPVKDLLDNPSNPAWEEVSVEFCGGTHLGSTSEAAAFAIVTEEAVAKGVRRVVALTGVPAQAAIAAADGVAQRVAAASRLDGPALQNETAEIGREIDQLTIPVSRKAELRATLAALQERVKSAQKQAAAGKTAEAVQQARQIAESAATSFEQVIVNTIQAGSDRAALLAAINAIQAKCPKTAIMLFSPDEEAGKVSVVAAVPPPLVQRGLNAGEWVREASAILGGKGGGKPESAQGGGIDLAKVKEAIGAAKLAAARKVS
jgi:alanyl-tRNA synthetase